MAGSRLLELLRRVAGRPPPARCKHGTKHKEGYICRQCHQRAVRGNVMLRSLLVAAYRREEGKGGVSADQI